MKNVELKYINVDLKRYMKRLASESDCSIKVDFDAIISVDGVPKILYMKLDGMVDTKYVRQACKNIKYSNVERLSRGLITKGKNRIFGYRPQRGMSKFAFTCSDASLKSESPNEHAVLVNLINDVSPFYKQYFPKEYDKNIEQLNDKVLSEWKIGDTPFTSGIVNKNSQLQYHYDIGHFKEAMSIMVVLKRGCNGGGICFPELDLFLPLDDNTLLVMDGQELMHGVTDIIPNVSDYYRNTIVYYSLQQMWKCLPINDEIIAARKMRADRERRRANGQVGTINKDSIKSGGNFSAKHTKNMAKGKAK